jgi:thiamine biosynthesis lipoprotein
MSGSMRYVSAALGLALAVSCSAPAPELRRADIFSSQVLLKLYDHASEELFEACFARLRQIDAAMNMWDSSSELSRLNARAGRGPVALSPDLAAAAARGLELARLSDGIFDPTIGPLVKLWGIGSARARIPSGAELRETRARVNWRRAKLDPAVPTLELATGMELDFGALAKGYGAMEGARLLAARGVRSAVLDVGGCVVVIGSDPRGKAWRVGVQDPLSPRGTPLGYFSLRDSAVDTSGVYERYFESGGHRYAHILDPRTGRPVEGSLVSATVALPRGENADGPALALLLLGKEAGLAWADRLGIAAVLIDTNKRVYLSKAARSIFTVTDSSYSISE